MAPETILFIGSLGLPAIIFTAGCLLCAVRTKRVGGLLFWQIGRIGGSIYISRAA